MPAALVSNRAARPVGRWQPNPVSALYGYIADGQTTVAGASRRRGRAELVSWLARGFGRVIRFSVRARFGQPVFGTGFGT